MSNDDPKMILVEVVIPVTVQLYVTWDGDEDGGETTIHRVELSPYGQMLEPRDIHENVDEDTLTVIDNLTKAAFGIKE